MKRNNWTALSLVLALCAVPLTGLSPVGDVPAVLTAVAVENADIPVWNGGYDTAWYDADEMEFHLTTPEQYAGFVRLQNQGVCKEGQTFYLDTDIDFNGQSIATISTFSGIL